MDAIVYDKVGKEAEKVREALYGIYPQETITDAAIASFDDGADGIPVKALTVGIELVQDLHGFANPWPAGGGKNLFPPLMFNDSDSLTYGGITMTPIANGFHLQGQTTTTGGRTNLVSKAFVLPAGTYTLSVKDGYSDIAPVVESSASPFPAVISGSGTFTLEAEASLLLGFQISATGSTVNKDYFVQIELGSTATDWTPYENICPISGWTGAKIPQRGKNLFGGVYNVFFPLHFNVDTQITASADTKGGSGNIQIAFYDSNQSQIDYWGLDTEGARDKKTFTYPATAYYVKFIRTESTNYQIELGSTVTDYAPYTGNQISVEFPTTIYGGEDEITTGKLKSTMSMVDLGTLTYAKSSTIQNGFVAISGMPADFPVAPSSAAVPNWLCSQYKVYSNNGIEVAGVDGAIAWRISGGAKGVIIRDSNYADYYTNNDMASFKTAMSGVQLCYERAEPVEYDLTPQTMETLYGANNIWANTGNIEKLTYRADLGKYIDSHITTAVANALNA